MENQRDKRLEQERNQEQGGEKKHSSAASIDNIISGATGNVRNRRSSSDWSNTGTNVSYEGPTAPAGGGSVGTGYASGQDATGARIAASAGDDALGREHNNSDEQTSTSEGEQLMKPEDRDDDLDRDTMGTP